MILARTYEDNEIKATSDDIRCCLIDLAIY